MLAVAINTYSQENLIKKDYKNSSGGLKLLMNNNYKSQKQLNFGVAHTSGLNKVKDVFNNWVDKTLKAGVNQHISNAINYTGKMLLAPLMILAGSKYTDESEESTKFAMLMLPLQAVLSLGVATGAGYIFNSFLDSTAKKGKLGDFYKDPKNFKELKNLSTAGMTILALPLVAKLLSWSLPKVMDKIEHKVPDKQIQQAHLNLYAQKLGPEFGNLKANFGNLTSNKWKKVKANEHQ